MDDLLGASEVSALLGGISRQRVHQIAASYDDFPVPAAVLARGRVWRRSDIERWRTKHPNRTPATRRSESAQ